MELTAPRTPPAVSVVVPVRDGVATIARCVRSVCEQRFTDFELIVVDDGSTDGTAASVQAFDDPRIIVRRLAPSGVSAARNAGVQLASGRYVTFLDCDDLAHPEWLDTLVGTAQSERASVVCSGVEIAGHRGGDHRKARVPSRQGHNECSTLFLSGSYLVERGLLLEVGGFDELLRFSENLELGIRLQQACRRGERRIAATDAVLVVMDRTRSGTSSAWRLEAIERIIDVHAAELRSDADRNARWLGIAAVEAARRRQRSKAVRYAARSIAARPGATRGWARLVFVLTPFLARSRWGTRDEPEA